MIRIGEDRTERLDIIPATFRVIATVRPLYVCPVAATSGMRQSISSSSMAR